MPCILERGLTVRQIPGCRISGVTLENLLRSSTESIKRGTVDRVCKVNTNRADWGFVTNAEPGRMHHVIEILGIALLEAERNVARRAEYITHVVEEYALNVFTQ